MANRMTFPMESLDHHVVVLSGKATFGASSAIASSDLNGLTIAKSATGVFDISVTDQWTSALEIDVTLFQATPSDLIIRMVSDDVTNATAASRKIVFQTWDISGAAAADPASGDYVRIRVMVRNSSSPRKGTS